MPPYVAIGSVARYGALDSVRSWRRIRRRLVALLRRIVVVLSSVVRCILTLAVALIGGGIVVVVVLVGVSCNRLFRLVLGWRVIRDRAMIWRSPASSHERLVAQLTTAASRDASVVICRSARSRITRTFQARLTRKARRRESQRRESLPAKPIGPNSTTCCSGSIDVHIDSSSKPSQQLTMVVRYEDKFNRYCGVGDEVRIKETADKAKDCSEGATDCQIFIGLDGWRGSAKVTGSWRSLGIA